MAPRTSPYLYSASIHNAQYTRTCNLTSADQEQSLSGYGVAAEYKVAVPNPGCAGRILMHHITKKMMFHSINRALVPASSARIRCIYIA